MGRTAGSRNSCYDDKKRALALSLLNKISQPGGPQTSLREFARAAGVSVATLRHYFGDREGILKAAMEMIHTVGRPHMESTSAEEYSRVPMQEMLAQQLGGIVIAWREHGVQQMFSAGLAAGLLEQNVGKTYVNEVLEPTIQLLEKTLRQYIPNSRADDEEIRYEAVRLISPLLIGLLHQDSLFGKECRILDVDRFLNYHLRQWMLSAPVLPQTVQGIVPELDPNKGVQPTVLAAVVIEA